MIFFRPIARIQFWAIIAFGVLGAIGEIFDPNNRRPIPSPPVAPTQNLITPPSEASPAAPSAPQEKDARAILSVQVPASAEVWLDDVRMTQTGALRLYRTPPLPRGEEYEYEVHARWLAGSQVVDATRHIKVHAGGKAELDFNRPDAGAP